MLSPFIVVLIYFLIKPLPTEIPPDDLLFESGVELHDGALLGLAISQYDKAIEINRYNLQAHQKRGDAYFAKGGLGHAMVDYNEAISLRSQLISDSVHGKGPLCLAASRKPTWEKPWSMPGKAGTWRPRRLRPMPWISATAQSQPKPRLKE